MTVRHGWLSKAGISAASASVAAMALALPLAAAEAPSLMALRTLETGQWQLRDLGPRGADRAMCVRDAEALIQLHHPQASCSRYVIDNRPLRATVHYTCPGSGYGRTTIDLITPRSVRIETQGVASGAPFHAEINGRRMGTCGASGT